MGSVLELEFGQRSDESSILKGDPRGSDMNGMPTYVKLVLIGLLTMAVVMFVFWLLSDKVP